MGFDQVDARDHFAHGVFDLDSRVDFDEVEVVLLVDDEFDGCGVVVIGLFDHPHGSIAHGFSGRLGESRRWAFFDEFLMATLDRAIALVEMNDVSVLVGDDLDFDVPRAIDVAFEIDAGVTEGCFGFCLGLGDSVLQRGFVEGDAHSFSSTTCGGFDQDGEADFAGGVDRVFFAFDQAVAAGDDRYTGGDGHFSGGVFVTEFFHRFGARADEFEVAAAADFVEVGVFGEESVAWVDRIGLAQFGSGDDTVDAQVAIHRLGRSDAEGLVGQFEVLGASIGFAEDCDGFDTEFFAGADYAQSDFATVGDKYATEHREL